MRCSKIFLVRVCIACLVMGSMGAAFWPQRVTADVEASPSYSQVEIRYSPIKSIGAQAGLMRRDPSDIIRVDGLYYVWYTKIHEGASGYPEGYSGELWYATSPDGVAWTEQGKALGGGVAGAFDEFGAFTPNILYAPTTKKYYLYYTGVRGKPSEKWTLHRSPGCIGVAVADSPTGGKTGWKRANGGQALLKPRTTVKGVFDGWHVDDTVMVFRDNKYWLYYKGHSLKHQLGDSTLPPSSTPMGVAVSDRPDGGFVRVPLNKKQEFLVQPGHELLLWTCGKGLCSLPTGHYRPKHPDDYRIHYAPDAMTFTPISPYVPTTRMRGGRGLCAPGIYRPDLTDPQAKYTGVLWGVCMTSYRRGSGLRRFEIHVKNTARP